MGELTEAEKLAQLDGFRKYPSLRDHPLKTAAQWIAGRRIDDECGDLWRVHDKLYDLTDFIDKHPGGVQWLEITRGTDITEAFESSHLNPSVNDILKKYYVREASSPRNSPFTFEPKGFYMTLKRRVHAEYSKLTKEEKEAGRLRVTTVQDRFLISFAFFLFLTGWTGSYLVAILAGFFLFMNINCAHNFFHQRDNWRMYAWDLGLLSSYEWRVTHALSHHIYTNSVLDFEISVVEPSFDFRVYNKSIFQRYSPIFTAFVLLPLGFFVEAIKRFISILVARQQKLRSENLLALAQIPFLYFLGCDFVLAIKLWLVTQASASWFFGSLGIIAAHHHPDLYHHGDGEFHLGLDWGLIQLDAVADRKDVNGNLLAELTMYGNHILHHLLPTIDHGLLDNFRPVFEQTCRDFNLPASVYNSPSQYDQWALLTGMYQQCARILPRMKKNHDS